MPPQVSQAQPLERQVTWSVRDYSHQLRTLTKQFGDHMDTREEVEDTLHSLLQLRNDLAEDLGDGSIEDSIVTRQLVSEADLRIDFAYSDLSDTDIVLADQEALVGVDFNF